MARKKKKLRKLFPVWDKTHGNFGKQLRACHKNNFILKVLSAKIQTKGCGITSDLQREVETTKENKQAASKFWEFARGEL